MIQESTQEEIGALREEVVVLRQAIDELREVLSHAVNNGRISVSFEEAAATSEPQQTDFSSLTPPTRTEVTDTPQTKHPTDDGMLF